MGTGDDRSQHCRRSGNFRGAGIRCGHPGRPAAILAYLICGLAVTLVLTCYIEIGSFLTRSGGGVAYVDEETFGPLMGPLAWVVYSVGYEVVACSALAAALLGSLAFWVPVLGHDAPRVFFLAAKDGMLPAALARVHPRFRTPHIAILTVAGLMFLLAAAGGFKHLAVLSSASILCVYLAICLGALKLRYTRKRRPGGPLVGFLDLRS